LQYFFFQISQVCACMDRVNPDTGLPPDCGTCYGAGESYLYDNLRDEDLVFGAMSLAQVQAKLERYLSTYPHGLIEALADDQRNDAGNEIRSYPVTGEALGMNWKQ
jgi:hypothetical protein